MIPQHDLGNARRRLIMVAAVASLGALAALALGGITSCTSCDVINVARSLWLALGLAACVGLLLLSRRRRFIPFGLALATSLLGLRDTMPVAQPCADGRPPVLKIVSFNLFKQNATPEAAAKWILAQDADAVVLVEAKGRSTRVPGLLRTAYPFQANCHPRGVCSTYILTRLRPHLSRPLARGDVENRESLSAGLVRLPTRDGDASIVAAHFSRPWPVGRQQREAVKLSADLLGLGSTDDLILAGDFNASEHMRWPGDLARNLGLGRLATAPTWPASGGPMPALVALDHVIVGTRWAGSARIGPFLGSDHRPLIAEICRR